MVIFPKFRLVTATVLLLVMSVFSFLNYLDAEPMHLWDESSYALNAYEMLESGNPIEISLFGKPDFYNSKPPFAIWCMALSMKVLGFNPLAVRLPAALFGVLATVLLFWIGLKVFKDQWIALCAPVVLMSSLGFVGEHVARTGDTDSILACWILAQSIFLYCFTESTEPKQQKLFFWMFTGCLILGCLTKGIAGLVAIPGILAWLLYKGKLLTLFKSSSLYYALLVFVVCVPGYYVLRNCLNPGYLDAVFNFEVGGRLTQQEFLNPEYRPFYYFYQAMLVDNRFGVWIYILPASVVYILLSPKSKAQSLGLFFVIALAGVSLSLAFSQTKLFWYDAPLYPLMAGVIGCALAILYEQAHKAQLVVAFGALAIFPYYDVVWRNVHPERYTHFPEFFNEQRKQGHAQDSLYIISADINFALYFYLKQDEMKGYYSKLVHPNDSSLKAGDLLITEKYARRVDIHNRFVLDTLQSYYECNLYKIVGNK